MDLMSLNVLLNDQALCYVYFAMINGTLKAWPEGEILSPQGFRLLSDQFETALLSGRKNEIEHASLSSACSSWLKRCEWPEWEQNKHKKALKFKSSEWSNPGECFLRQMEERTPNRVQAVWLKKKKWCVD